MNNLHLWVKNNFSSLERINKILMMVALALLAIRSGNFYITHIPKPFEFLFIVIVSLTIIDVVKNNKFKEFFNSIPRNIRVALGLLFLSVLIGLSITIFIRGVPLNFYMLTEFGRLMIAAMLFMLILFYTREDKSLVKKFLFAIISPILYVVLLMYPEYAFSHDYAHISDGRFYGFSGNVNTISKLLLMPAMFFISYSLFWSKSKWQKIIFILLSAGSVALLLWAASRGALLALAVGLLAVFALFMARNFFFKEIVKAGVIILSIFILGFLFTPYSGKQVVLNRMLNKDTDQTHYYWLKDRTLKDIVADSFSKKNQEKEDVSQVDNPIKEEVGQSVDSDKGINLKTIVKAEYDGRPINTSVIAGVPVPETRAIIWPFHIKQALKNPFGVGPGFNTHIKVFMPQVGDYVGTGSHSSFIEQWLWGGVVGLVSFCYILFKAGQNLRIKIGRKDHDVMIVALAGIFIALIVAIFFDDSSKLFWVWAISALAIKYES